MTKKRLIALMVLLAVLVVGCRRGRDETFQLTPGSQPAGGTNSAPASNASSGSTMGTVSYADVVTKAAPAVVTIHSQTRVRQPQQFPFMNDPFFRQFFGDRQAQPPV